MIRLSNKTPQTLELITSQNGASVTVSYVDGTSTSSSGTQPTIISSAATTTICAYAPVVNTSFEVIRAVDHIAIRSTYAGSQLVTLQMRSDGGRVIPLISALMLQNDCLEYADGLGFHVLDANGNTKMIISGAVLGDVSITGVQTLTAVGTQEIISSDASKFRVGQQSTLTSGTLYSTVGNLLSMRVWMHNFSVDTLGNISTADATGYCAMIDYREDDVLAGYSSAAAVTAGTTPTLANTWSIDNKTGVASFGIGATNVGVSLTVTSGGPKVVDVLGALVASPATLDVCEVFALKGNSAIAGVTFGPSDSRLITFGVDPTNAAYLRAAGLKLQANTVSIVLASAAGDVLKVDSSGNTLHVNPAGGLGYGTGSGGTVTQTTSKSTAVTLNKSAGQITTTADSLASGASVSFSVNNLILGVNDNVVPTIATFNNYRVRAYITSPGVFAITLTNEAGASLSEAVKINFAIIKGATN